MDIPSKRRRSSDHDRARSGPVEGFAASYKRVTYFEAVDTRVRRDSAVSVQRHGEEEGPANSDLLHGDAVDEAVTERTMLLSHDDEESDSLYTSTKSTTAQTVFNITNLLIGIGLLSLPLGMRLAGWIIGCLMLLIGAVITAYTAVLLSRALETDPGAYAYSDIGRLAYGRKMTLITALIFMLELSAAGSALMILFGDNFSAVIPAISSNTFKIACFLVMLPATLLPLRILSYTSIIGIISTIALIVVVFVDGIWKKDAPGSLHKPMPTDTLPSHWMTVPLAIGLMMAPFGGHGIFPQVYTDMQDRKQFARSIWIAYAFSTGVCLFVGIIGYLMFGSGVEAEITINLLQVAGYPKTLNKIAVLMTGITSLTKIPLATKSISANIDVLIGLKTLREEQRNGWRRFGSYLSVRLFVNLSIFVLAFLIPEFDRVMSVLGSAFVFLISVILPALFYVRIMGRTKTRTLTSSGKSGLWILIGSSAVIAAIGTAWAFLPRDF